MERLAEDVKKLREDVDRIMQALGLKGVPIPDALYSIEDRVKALEKDTAELQTFTASQLK